jgi:ubiquinone/menaquinone biosynthesis C-methylase UbiE
MQTVDRQYFPMAPGQRLLDLGCGEGRHVIAASALDGIDAIGVDLSREDLGTARERMREFADQLPEERQPALFALLVGDALRLPFPDDSFDAVICSEVLEHIPDYRSAVREIHRVLKPRGYFCASVPRPWCERLCWWLSRDYHQVPGGHLRIFEIEDLIGEIHSNGFELYQRHGAHALHSVYWWLQCLFWKNRERSWLVRQYHRLLVWDMMKRPAITRALERALNPVLGKSVVMYFRKAAD